MAFYCLSPHQTNEILIPDGAAVAYGYSEQPCQLQLAELWNNGAVINGVTPYFESSGQQWLVAFNNITSNADQLRLKWVDFTTGQTHDRKTPINLKFSYAIVADMKHPANMDDNISARNFVAWGSASAGNPEYDAEVFRIDGTRKPMANYVTVGKAWYVKYGMINNVGKPAYLAILIKDDPMTKRRNNLTITVDGQAGRVV